MQLTENVYVETKYMGANVGFITTKKGIIMIESPQKPTDAIQWRDRIKEKGEVKYLINTEGHEDHVAGNFFFDVPIICHNKTKERILSANKKQLLDQISHMDPDGVHLMKDYEFKLPDLTFSHNMTLYAGDHTFQLMNTPGHTEGQTTVFIPEEKVVFTGDNINFKMPAFMLESLPFTWIESIKFIKTLDIDHIVPGHGEICKKNYLDEWAEFIQEWIDTVQDAISKGWSKEEAIEKVEIPSRFSFPPGAPQDMTKMIRYMNITRLYDQLLKK